MSGVKLDGTVSAGHILTALTLLISVVAAYYSLREEVHANTMRIEHVEEILTKDIKSINEDMKLVNKALERIYDKLDKQ